MITAIQLYNHLNELIPRTLNEEWDNDGLMCAAGIGDEVKKVMVTLDVTEEAVERAVKNGIDTIISHHPLIFKPIKNIQSNKLISLIRHNITVMSFHTRLDAIENGVNSQLANILELDGVEVFGGLGRVGYMPREYAFYDFIQYIKNLLNSPNISAVRQKNVVRHVAVTGGDGKDYYNEAKRTGADTYLTGSMSYNTMVDAAEGGMNVIAAGHYQTENLICKYLEQLVLKIDGGIEVEIFESDPILYF